MTSIISTAAWLTYRRKVEAIISLLRTLGYRFVTFDELAERMENKSERK